jgi:hypothetical protein
MRVIMKLAHVLAVAALALPMAVFAADRMTDRDVKALVERVDSEREQFEDALDSKLKSEILRTAAGEVNVNNFLDDFESNIGRLKDRLQPDYSASAEATTVLRQGTDIDGYFRKQPAGTRGESEWNRLAADLKSLAAVYGTTFPLPANATVRRMSDREVAAGVDALAKSADRLKQSLDTELKKDATVNQQAREAVVTDADQLKQDAELLRERLRDGQASSSESAKVLAQAAKIQSALGGRKAPESLKLWSQMTPQLQTLAGVYGTVWPPVR